MVENLTGRGMAVPQGGADLHRRQRRHAEAHAPDHGRRRGVRAGEHPGAAAGGDRQGLRDHPADTFPDREEAGHKAAQRKPVERNNRGVGAETPVTFLGLLARGLLSSTGNADSNDRQPHTGTIPQADDIPELDVV